MEQEYKLKKEMPLTSGFGIATFGFCACAFGTSALAAATAEAAWVISACKSNKKKIAKMSNHKV
jgi:hypothetical protein